MSRSSSALLLLIGLQVPVFAQTPPPTPATPGFNTPTLVTNPGSQSTGNGFTDTNTLQEDQQVYEKEHDVNDGLGPLFNARSCVDCHQNPVSGGASQFTEVRAGHKDPTSATFTFVPATVFINDNQVPVPATGGRSLINQRAVEQQAQEHVPVTENLRELRAALSALGDGFVESIADQTLIDISTDQAKKTHGRIHGEYNFVPVFEATGMAPRVGRFGWKDQHGSLLSFVADAYVNEMGITSRLRMSDFTTVGKVTSDPEDKFVNGLEDIDHFTRFLRDTDTPPRDPAYYTDTTLQNNANAGQALFEKIGCGICHVSQIVTAAVGTPEVVVQPPAPNAGTAVAGGFVVPAALANKIIHPFGDYLLHDIGTAGGIVQTPNFGTTSYQDTAFKFRTEPLWGLHTRPQYLHDLRSLTLEDAIARHQGEAELESRRFFELSDADRQLVITFLNTL